MQGGTVTQAWDSVPRNPYSTANGKITGLACQYDLSKDKPMDEIEKIYIGIEEGRTDRLTSLRESIDENYAFGRLSLAGENAKWAANSAIVLAMARVRFKKDLPFAVDALNKGVSFAKNLIDCEAKLRDQGGARSVDKETLLAAGSFWWQQLCCLLAGDWVCSEGLASCLSSPAVVDRNDGVFYDLARLLASLIQDDRDLFFANRLVKKPLKEKHPVFAPFILLAQAAMLRDQESFTSQLTALHEDFRLRAKSRTGGLEEYGYGQKNNALCLDFQSIAVCKIASKRGMKITVESEYIPLTLVNYWQS